MFNKPTDGRMKELFRQMMRERREWPSGSMDWQWRTRAAETYLKWLRGIPAQDW